MGLTRKEQRELDELEKEVAERNENPNICEIREKIKFSLNLLADAFAEFFGQAQLNTNSTDDDIYNTAMLSQKTGIPKNTLVQWRMTGDGPKFFKVGKSVYYRGKEVRDWAAKMPKYEKTSEHEAKLL